jgi:nitrate reductase gamma subunit
MIDSLLLIALPYVAIVVCIVGSVWRIRTQAFGLSALSSQFLESRKLLWGSLPWHIGIGLILAGHLIALFCPELWRSLLANPTILLVIESAGIGLACLSVVGLMVLFWRRLTSARIQAVTSVMDLVVLTLLLGQIVIGMIVALQYHWGAVWATTTATPYVWSLATLQPDVSFVADLPPLMKAHIVGAWLLILLIPFSRLIHIFTVPLEYLFRPPQKVVWTNPRHHEATAFLSDDEARRDFIKGMAALFVGGALLSVGALDKVFRFFFGPRLSPKEEAEIMGTRVKRLEATANEKKLELERQTSDYIFVAKLSELQAKEGKYFIDFAMCPALAFLDGNNLPNLISAKCTHLGCTVLNQVDSQGRILCPCHLSYFDIATGVPNAGAPAKEPLPHLPWAVMDESGKMVAHKSANGKIIGTAPAGNAESYSVFLAKHLAEESKA